MLVFFAISGWLVTKSWLSDPNARRFMARRCLRIFPALIVVVLVAALVLGPIATTLPLRDYVTSHGAWAYVAKNLTLFKMQFDLPGVFQTLPYSSVNGSLWTLPVEFRAYLLLALLGMLGALRRSPVAVCALVALGCLVAGPALDQLANHLLLATFFISAALASAQPPLRVVAALAFVATLGCVVLPLGRGLDLAVAIGVPSLVWLAAFALPRTARWLEGRDVSYGIYLWAFPVQQVIVSAGIARPLELAAVSLAFVVLLASASWVLVERPALRLKPRSAPQHPESSADLARTAPAA